MVCELNHPRSSGLLAPDECSRPRSFVGDGGSGAVSQPDMKKAKKDKKEKKKGKKPSTAVLSFEDEGDDVEAFEVSEETSVISYT